MKKYRFNFLASGFLVIIFIVAYGALLIKEKNRYFRTFSVISVCILLLSVLALYLALPKIVAAYEVRFNPGVFEGPVGVVGELNIDDDGNMTFIIKKCKNRRMYLPVKYDGHKYTSGTHVIAYGTLEWSEIGEYCFCANHINEKEDDLKGSLIYFARRLIEKHRKWIYEHCPTCAAWKKKLIGIRNKAERNKEKQLGRTLT